MRAACNRASFQPKTHSTHEEPTQHTSRKSEATTQGKQPETAIVSVLNLPASLFPKHGSSRGGPYLSVFHNLHFKMAVSSSWIVQAGCPLTHHSPASPSQVLGTTPDSGTTSKDGILRGAFLQSRCLR